MTTDHDGWQSWEESEHISYHRTLEGAMKKKKFLEEQLIQRGDKITFLGDQYVPEETPETEYVYRVKVQPLED